jgi:hypothetical protein
MSTNDMRTHLAPRRVWASVLLMLLTVFATPAHAYNSVTLSEDRALGSKTPHLYVRLSDNISVTPSGLDTLRDTRNYMVRLSAGKSGMNLGDVFAGVNPKVS